MTTLVYWGEDEN